VNTSGKNEEIILSDWLKSADAKKRDNGKPLVLISYASSLDGSIAARQGSLLTISSDESLKAVHILRSRCDAILVGIGTVLSDNPRLSVRKIAGINPVPVIIDTGLRTPPDSRIFNENRNPVIFCGRERDNNRKMALISSGAYVIETDMTGYGLSLPEILHILYDKGIRSLMVEGGAKIIRSFINTALWDMMAVTVAPLLIGGYKIIDENTLNKPLRFNNPTWINSGPDQICLIERDTA